ncbi:MAG: FAD-binding oxidoreductase [Proteobacteria bacterium]|nr:FAD-binding oxidoreductase [Pseudomonadota bacterium]
MENATAKIKDKGGGLKELTLKKVANTTFVSGTGGVNPQLDAGGWHKVKIKNLDNVTVTFDGNTITGLLKDLHVGLDSDSLTVKKFKVKILGSTTALATNTDFSVSVVSADEGPTRFKHSDTATGGVVGGGLEYKATSKLSLGVEGSCQIGGNLSTNAGGVRVLRYGTARDLVLGLEVVLPDGQVLDGLRGLRKDNTGYDLKHLFIGAEGTLGVITAAVLKLFPRPHRIETALAAAADAGAALALFQRATELAADALTAFEFLDRRSLELAVAHIEGIRDPFAEAHGCYALIELSGFGDGNGGLKQTMEEILSGAMEQGMIADAVIAASSAQAAELWRLRDAVPEAQPAAGASIKHDISVPVSRVPEFLSKARALVEADMPGVRPIAFGHLGDGNIHFNLGQPEDMDADAFLAEWQRVNRMVHDLVAELGGSFSAEHGIGALKREDLKRYKTGPELDLMKALKAALDPKGIMNPGKVL